MAQSEQHLENDLLTQLEGLGYERVALPDEAALLRNLQQQLEAFNGVSLSASEFERVLLTINRGTIFERAQLLRDRVLLDRDNDESIYLQLLDTRVRARNRFQVAQQITVEGRYKNRYDVTLLVNGLPLVQIELKRRGVELREAYLQIRRYQRESYGANHALFLYVQFFVISNGVNTKYFAHHRSQDKLTDDFKQTFYWASEDNRRINRLEAFAATFLEPDHLWAMISRYMVRNQAEKKLFILRPYQYYAIQAILKRVRKGGQQGGYIWHTTGSGKTLTSFKASQLILDLPEVDRVVFVVDRKDLDHQTMEEFNKFAKGSVDATTSTGILIDQLTDQYKDENGPKLTPLVVTTIQKLHIAISKARYRTRMAPLKQERVVFIFDECHRSQFGITHEAIVRFFENSQLFGFTGTPIFVENASKNEKGKRTTKELFGQCLHQYVITDAIHDENVLPFSVEYVGRYRMQDSANEIDIQVEGIDTRELLEAPDRLEKIVDYILQYHSKKTYQRQYTAIFCVSSIPVLTQYYELFRAKLAAGAPALRIATIFSYGANEEDRDDHAFFGYDAAAEPEAVYKSSHSRACLETYIGHYNEQFKTNYHTRDAKALYNYYQDVSKKVKKGKIDLLLVVNMFLTGFDSKKLNTLYVDKNLRHHGLLQAYSRTNRIDGQKKAQGHIVTFRNLKKNTDEALALFSQKNPEEDIFRPPYEDFVEDFNEAADDLLTLTPTIDAVDDLYSEEEVLAFVKAFRQLLRLKNDMQHFSDFDFDDLALTEQQFEDFKSKYLDIYDRARQPKEKTSILNDVDFVVELIHQDRINVTYILRLLADLQKSTDTADRTRQEKAIQDLLSNTPELRSKKALIERFIRDHLPALGTADIHTAFKAFWNAERRQAFEQLCQAERFHPERLQALLTQYLFTSRPPLSGDVVKALTYTPKLLERQAVAERLQTKIQDFAAVFFEGVDFG